MRAVVVLAAGTTALAATFLPWLANPIPFEAGTLLRTWIEVGPPNRITGVVGTALAAMATAELVTRRWRPSRLAYAVPALCCVALTLAFIAARAPGQRPIAIGCYVALAAHTVISLAALPR